MVLEPKLVSEKLPFMGWLQPRLGFPGWDFDKTDFKLM